MSDTDTSTLWRISAFERLRDSMDSPQFAALGRQTMLSSTMQAELRVMERRASSSDAIEMIATCLRLREAALIYLQFDELVWPVTLFPADKLYHSPRSLEAGAGRALASVRAISIEPAAVRPPGHWMHERVAEAENYHPLDPALWGLALQGPRTHILPELGGTAAYRVLRDPAREGLPTAGALGATVQRLRRETASLRAMAQWPGMSIDRVSRLVNALYLTSNLMVSRTHPAARPEPEHRFALARAR